MKNLDVRAFAAKHFKPGAVEAAKLRHPDCTKSVIKTAMLFNGYDVSNGSYSVHFYLWGEDYTVAIDGVRYDSFIKYLKDSYI